MEEKIKNRILKEANFLIDTKKTLRETSKISNVSKSTVHKDVNERLININKDIYKEVKKVLEDNKNERHIRGGESTKRKYERK